MKTQVALFAILALASLTSATVSSASTADDVVLFVQKNKAANNIYGLYFLEKDENPLFSAITGLFSPEKEVLFNNLINKNDSIKMLVVDVRKGDLKKVADQMRIPSYPFTIVYFSNDANDIVSGPADEDTAIKILDHKKPVAVAPPPPPPPKPTPPPPQPAPKPTTIRDLNRPIEEDDSWKNYKKTAHQYDYVNPVNQYLRPDFVPIAPEVIVPAGPRGRPVEVVERFAPRQEFVERVAPRVEVIEQAGPVFNPWAAPTGPAFGPAPVRGPVLSGPVRAGPAPVVAQKLLRP
jgi:hypothetical protein